MNCWWYFVVLDINVVNFTQVVNTKIRFLIHVTISRPIWLYEDIDIVAILLLVSPYFVPDWWSSELASFTPFKLPSLAKPAGILSRSKLFHAVRSSKSNKKVSLFPIKSVLSEAQASISVRSWVRIENSDFSCRHWKCHFWLPNAPLANFGP